MSLAIAHLFPFLYWSKKFFDTPRQPMQPRKTRNHSSYKAVSPILQFLWRIKFFVFVDLETSCTEFSTNTFYLTGISDAQFQKLIFITRACDTHIRSTLDKYEKRSLWLMIAALQHVGWLDTYYKRVVTVQQYGNRQMHAKRPSQNCDKTLRKINFW